MNDTKYSQDKRTEEDKDFFDKYSATGESEWSRESTVPFEDDVVLRERHYNVSPFPEDLDTSKGIPYRSDIFIQQEAIDLIHQNIEVGSSDVELIVTDGVVKLSGTVKTRMEKKAIENIAERVPGVIDVENHLVIESPRRKGLIEASPLP